MSQLTEVLAAVGEGKHVAQRQIGSRVMKMETGEVAKQAGGAVVVTVGETVVLVTACASPAPREGVDFFPLTVDYEERMYAAGKIPGGWIKREGRPPERAILASRCIDRPCRPLFPEGFRNDVQITGICMSVDEQNNPDVLALSGAGAALSLSDIPFDGPMAGVRVAYKNDRFYINPTDDELQGSELNLVVAGTRSNLNMVECGCHELPESILIEAFEEAHKAIREIIDMIEELVAVAGKPKGEYPVYSPSADLEVLVRKYQYDQIAQAMRVLEKQARDQAFSLINLADLRSLIEADATLSENDKAAALALCSASDAGKDYGAISKHIKEEELMTMIVDEGIRPDGRRTDQIRPLWGRIGVLPRPHGSAIFTRGQTQVMSVVTLGTVSEGQNFDNIFGEDSRRYMHQYNFPPFSVGEARSMRSPGRREIGHGALAERALLPVIPSVEEFPYAIRVVSDVLESNGSSSMASTCGSTLALMDAGVPLKRPVAGIAMGLIKKGEKCTVLTDIQGMEDAFGEMDFKVTGTDRGVTALQMDIKLKGVTMDVLARALEQAKAARMTILDMITEVIPEPREELSQYAPKVLSMQIAPERIKDVIGPGGKIINKIIADTGAKVEIEQDGRVFIAAVNRDSADRAQKMVHDLTRDVVAGEEYDGKVMRIMDFGAFIEILPGREGLLHVSKIMPYHVRSVEDVVKIGDQLKVKVEEIDNLGRINLTRRGLWTEEEMAAAGENAGDMEEERPRRPLADRPRAPRGMDRGPKPLGDRAPRGDRGARSERPARPARFERSERPERPSRMPERADRAAMSLREERGGRYYDEGEERPTPRRREDSYDERPAPRRREDSYDERPAPRRRSEGLDERPAPRRREESYDERPAPRRREESYDERPAPRRREEYTESVAPHYTEDAVSESASSVRRRRRRRADGSEDMPY